MTDTSLDGLKQAIKDFSNKVEAVRNQPDAVDTAFRTYAAWRTATESNDPMIAPIGAAYGYIFGDDYSGQVDKSKGDIKDQIRSLLQKLADGIESMEAAPTFIESSNDWKIVGKTILGAQNAETTRGSFTHLWQGHAADRYGDVRDGQNLAMDSLMSVCDQMATNMATIGQAALAFYSDLVTRIADFLAKFASALRKITFGYEATTGISECLELLTDMISQAAGVGSTLITALTTQSANNGSIAAAITNPKGFSSDNTWPVAIASDFDRNQQGGDWEAV